jgi:hypothetical protein
MLFFVAVVVVVLVLVVGFNASIVVHVVVSSTLIRRLVF